MLAFARLTWAQDSAPPGFTNGVFVATITNASAPFISNGAYELITSVVGNSYVVSGKPGGGFDHGSFLYNKLSPSNAIISLTDAQGGAYGLRLAFSSLGAGTFQLTNAAGTQGGNFTWSNYYYFTPPALFFSSDAAGPGFQFYLGGHEGINYAIETSTNFTTWSTWTNLALSDPSVLVSNIIGPSAKYLFYRARAFATAFAPDTITGLTFTVTVKAGSVPLFSNGVYQLAPDPTGNGYQIHGGPGTTNSSGTYSYTKLNPDSAVITMSDSRVGAEGRRLVFTSRAAGHYYATNSSGAFEAGTFTVGTGPRLLLGNINGAPDLARGASVIFPADGTAVTFSVTNGAGYVWTLTLPSDALFAPRRISMIPFGSVNSANSVIPVLGGVLLDPDGIQFADPVLLTVKPPVSLGTNVTLVLANEDGSSVYLLLTTNNAGSYSAWLTHFSSGGVSDPPPDSLTPYLPAMQAAYDQAKADVIALKRVVVSPPPPPDFEIKCDPDDPSDAAQEAALDRYTEELFRPEYDAITRLLSATRSLLFLGVDHEAEALDLSGQLIRTAAFRKVNALITGYAGNPLKLVSVITIALGVDRKNVLLGGQETTAWYVKLAAQVPNFRKYYLDKLRNNHDFRIFKIYLGIVRQMELLQGLAGQDQAQIQADENQALDDLAKALNFKVSIDISANLSGGSELIEAKGSPTCQFTKDTFLNDGHGTFNYVAGTIPGYAELILPNAFPVHVQLGQVDCQAQTVTLIIDQLGAPSEMWIAFGQVANLGGTLEGAALAALQDEYQEGGNYVNQFIFSLPFQNLQTQCVDTSVPGDGGGTTVSVHFTIQHQPK